MLVSMLVGREGRSSLPEIEYKDGVEGLVRLDWQHTLLIGYSVGAVCSHGAWASRDPAAYK